MSRKITIAIDGYSSCGKSTLAKDLAKELHYRYIDTGAMYRAVTLYFLRNNIVFSPDNMDQAQINDALDHIHIGFHVNVNNKKSEVLLNEEVVEEEIRAMDVADNVSTVSAIKEVRKRMTALQQEMGHNKGVILDGRDIGTVVFPHAELKIFVTAQPEIRVKRRFNELKVKGLQVPIEDIRHNLEQRDHDDVNRTESPLKKADDAVLIDNSHITKEQQLAMVLKLAREKISA